MIEGKLPPTFSSCQLSVTLNTIVFFFFLSQFPGYKCEMIWWSEEKRKQSVERISR